MDGILLLQYIYSICGYFRHWQTSFFYYVLPFVFDGRKQVMLVCKDTRACKWWTVPLRTIRDVGLFANFLRLILPKGWLCLTWTDLLLEDFPRFLCEHLNLVCANFQLTARINTFLLGNGEHTFQPTTLIAYSSGGEKSAWMQSLKYLAFYNV